MADTATRDKNPSLLNLKPGMEIASDRNMGGEGLTPLNGTDILRYRKLFSGYDNGFCIPACNPQNISSTFKWTIRTNNSAGLSAVKTLIGDPAGLYADIYLPTFWQDPDAAIGGTFRTATLQKIFLMLSAGVALITRGVTYKSATGDSFPNGFSYINLKPNTLGAQPDPAQIEGTENAYMQSPNISTPGDVFTLGRSEYSHDLWNCFTYDTEAGDTVTFTESFRCIADVSLYRKLG